MELFGVLLRCLHSLPSLPYEANQTFLNLKSTGGETIVEGDNSFTKIRGGKHEGQLGLLIFMSYIFVAECISSWRRL